MVHFVRFLEAAQDGACRLLRRRLVDLDELEAAGEGHVLLDALAVLAQCRRADAAQLPTGERGLEQVGGVGPALGASGAQAMSMCASVDEEDDVARLAHLGQDPLEALLELAAKLRAGDERPQVQRDDDVIDEALRYASLHDALGQTLRDRGLADARLADEQGVVLEPAAQHLDDLADLGIAPYHRIGARPRGRAR